MVMNTNYRRTISRAFLSTLPDLHPSVGARWLPCKELVWALLGHVELNNQEEGAWDALRSRGYTTVSPLRLAPGLPHRAQGERAWLLGPCRRPLRKQQGRRNINAAANTEEQMRASLQVTGWRGPTRAAASSLRTD
ncbi:hypothetical protein VULLAG_LOCUS2096 [Vulpes lagopus]